MPTKEELEQENSDLRKQLADMEPVHVVSPHSRHRELIVYARVAVSLGSV